ncbi:MAG TPA: PEGA domain-containing protein, partial [Bryobacteraceae bacterium]|nr:PEGA domain-containing protein [Bryobacteraceae bacterium]
RARHSGRNIMLGLLAAGCIGVAIFLLWPNTQPAAPAAPLVVDSAVPSGPAAPDPAPAQPVVQQPEAAPVAAKPVEPKTLPGPTEASFELTTMPAGAEAVFDGNTELKCTTPCNLNLAMGRHTLLVKNPGYRETQRVFTLPSDPGLIVNLEAMAGMLSLVTNPPGLTVIIDGQQQTRKTPANFSLPVGEHRVQVLRGSEKQEFTAQIRDNVVSQKNIDWGP